MVTKATTEELHDLLRRMLDAGNMTRQHYLKCLVGLAHEYVTAADLEGAKRLIGEFDDEYLAETLPAQMADDPAFRERALFVARKLSESGISDEAAEDRLMETFAKVGKA